jgi:hypothetical protein
MNVHKAIWHYDRATVEAASLCGEDGFEIRYVVSRCGGRIHCEGQSGGFEWFQVNIAAVFMLMISSNFTGACTGSSPGLSPFKMRSA